MRTTISLVTFFLLGVICTVVVVLMLNYNISDGNSDGGNVDVAGGEGSGDGNNNVARAGSSSSNNNVAGGEGSGDGNNNVPRAGSSSNNNNVAGGEGSAEGNNNGARGRAAAAVISILHRGVLLPALKEAADY